MYIKVVAVEKLVVGMELLCVCDVGETSCCGGMVADIKHLLVVAHLFG